MARLPVRVTSIRRAGELDYEGTTVYYLPRDGAAARQLARALGASARPLPDGAAGRLLVIAGR